MSEQYVVRWVGDFAVIYTTAPWAESETDAIDFTRQELIDWHSIDPEEQGFTPEVETQL